MTILNPATYHILYVCVCVFTVCVCVRVCVYFCASFSELEYTVIKGEACHSCVSRGWGDQTPYIKDKGKGRLRGEAQRSTANEGEEGSGISAKAPIVLQARSSKDKLVASATLRLPLNSCLTCVYGRLCVSEEKGIVKWGFVCLPLIYFLR